MHRSTPLMAEANSSRHERRHVYYSGRVQGVGFRYTVRQIAAQHAVSGYVQNLSDGRVELVVEGSVDELNKFMTEIAARMGDHIRNTSIDSHPSTNREFDGFEIRH